MSTPVPAGMALGSCAVSGPLIATSDPHKQEGRGDLDAGQQEEVPVHLAIVDVPWGKERRAWRLGRGRAPPELAAEAAWPVGGMRRPGADGPLASGRPGSRQFPVSQLFFGGLKTSPTGKGGPLAQMADFPKQEGALEVLRVPCFLFDSWGNRPEEGRPCCG